MKDHADPILSSYQTDGRYVSEEVAAAISACAKKWPGMPVRAMEGLIAHGEDAVGAILRYISQDLERQGTLSYWLIVVLGELRSPAAVEILSSIMCRSETPIPAVAALEALAKVGEPALPELRRIASMSIDTTARLFAYSAIGYIDAEEAHRFLLARLKEDARLVDIIAYALTCHPRGDELDAIRELLPQCTGKQRRELEDAIEQLVAREPTDLPIERNWRLRYRNLPQYDWAPDMSVPAIAAITLKYSAPEASPSPEEEVVLKDPVTKDHTETDMRCNRCGTPVQATTGIPVCAEQERVIFLSQLDKLRSWKRDGYADTFDVLEGLDHEDWHLRTGHGKNATAALVPMLPEADRKRLEEVEIGRRTLLFLIERGAGTLAEGFEALKLVAPSLRAQPPVSRFIVPASVMDMLLSQGIDAPPLADLRKRPHLRHEAGGGESARATRAKIGPNQQCPCGSGKKFKKCCRDAAG